MGTANMLVMVLNIVLLFFLPFLPCRPTVNNGRDLSRFQAAVQHCCSSKTSKTPHRCFELNEFSGVNFVASPCRFLKTLEKSFSAVESSDQIALSDVGFHIGPIDLSELGPSDQIDSSDVEPSDQIDSTDVEPSDQVDSSDLDTSYQMDSPEPEVQITTKSVPPITLSTFQSAVQNCCSNRNSNTPYRCFEVNGVVGVNFVARPCMFLHTINSMLEEEEAD